MDLETVQLKLKLDKDLAQKFCTFAEMLQENNLVINLTSITEDDEIIEKHFLDSLLLYKNFTLEKGIKVLDVGTGAGFPGIPLGIMNPHVSFTLLDAREKRIQFIDEVVKALQLTNVITIHGRTETFGRDSRYRESFDVVLARAVSPLPVLLEYCIPFVKESGVFVAYKSQKLTEEIEISANAFVKLECHIDRIETHKVGDALRKLVFVRKEGKTPKKYPRRLGIPSKRPL